MTRRSVVAGAGALTATLASAGEPPSFAYENAQWFDGTRFQSGTLYSVGDRFVSDRPRSARIVDLSGTFVVPPFADAHNHSLGYHPAAADKAVVARFIADGVLYGRMMGPTGVDEAAKSALGLNRPGGLDMAFADGQVTGIGGHPFELHRSLLRFGVLEGLTSEQLNGATHWQIGSEAELNAKWPLIRRLHGDLLKIVVGGPEAPAELPPATAPIFRGLDSRLVPIVVRKAHREGLLVAAHISTAADFSVAVRAGVDQLAHPPGFGELDPSMVALAGRRRVAVTTTLAALDSMPPGIVPAPTKAAMMDRVRGYFRQFRAAGMPIIIGSDNVRDTSAAEADFLHKRAYFGGAELLRMWSADTAIAMFPKRRIGRLAEGHEASFLVLDGNPLTDWSATRRIRLRVKQGVTVVSPSAT